MRLHFNKSNGIFSVRREDRSTVAATERHGKLPRMFDTFKLAPNVHIIVTRGLYEAAAEKSRPFVPVVVTKWPNVKGFFMRLKEIINE
ncbi:hypothetical protein [Klebsiella phage 175022]|uniref:Uncharacterized protein n=4 Tax=Przondovirus TaxID=1985720 RepID=A0A9E7T0T6_9CAUD|nr:BC10 family protein [Klebsiella phage vB_KpnP_IME205]YP_009796984.1 BC10 family protein [Klebsiella phage SH-Kp 152410]ALT58466.1 hypothetical protein [Klebsiella phage vB_KpnP_IME205]AUV61475.1 hypothetical protein 2410_orf0009 [Klebsiella phage SH-Kp 152410]UTQ78130.1 hypothetical protein JB48_40 [Klebsiella phage JB48]